MSESDRKRYRVVVVGVAKGKELSARDLATSLCEYFPLAPDAQVAIESGRSAVVQVAESEPLARRAATMLIKLGAEIRIEPESSGPGTFDFDDIDLDAIADELEDLELDVYRAPRAQFSVDENAPTSPLNLSDVPPAPVLVDRPPVDDDERAGAPRSAGRASGPRRTGHTTRELDAVSRGDATPVTEDPDAAAAEDTPAGEPTGDRGQLVRCPAHGLLYDASQSAGCTRCLGPSAEAPFRLAPELRKRPRLWLTLGLALGLLLGAVPAALYVQNLKSGALYERRIEADTIRRTRSHSKYFKQQYAKARAKVTTTRNRGIALSALIWIGVTAVLMLLWYRFI